MAKNFQKSELIWIGKGKELKLEPRIAIEDPSIPKLLDYQASKKGTRSAGEFRLSNNLHAVQDFNSYTSGNKWKRAKLHFR